MVQLRSPQVCVQLVQMVDGLMIPSNFGPKVDVFAAMEIRGFKFIGPCNRPGLRPELQCQPMFANLAGPMWGGTTPDGTPIVRYEDADTCKHVSA